MNLFKILILLILTISTLFYNGCSSPSEQSSSDSKAKTPAPIFETQPKPKVETNYTTEVLVSEQSQPEKEQQVDPEPAPKAKESQIKFLDDNKFQIEDKVFVLKTEGENPNEKFRINQKTNNVEYFKATGDVTFESDEMKLKCAFLEYDMNTEIIVAKGWKDKRLQMISEGLIAYSNHMTNNLIEKKIILTGNAEVHQEDHKAITKIYGEQIVRIKKENEDTEFTVTQKPSLDYNKKSGTETKETNPNQVTTPQPEFNLGDKVNLVANEETGTFLLLANKAGELVYFDAENDVVLKAEKMDLDCDKLEFLEGGDKIVATGKLVTIRQGDKIGKCQHFEHYPENKKSLLRAKDFQPEVEDKFTITKADEIDFTELENGKIDIDARGNIDIKTLNKPAEKDETTTKGDEEAEKVEEKPKAPRKPTLELELEE